MGTTNDSIISIATSTAEINRFNLNRAINAGEDATAVALSQEEEFNRFIEAFSEEEAALLRDAYYEESRRLADIHIKELLDRTVAIPADKLNRPDKPVANRSAMRAFVLREDEERKKFIAAGGNVFQFNLDAQDAMDEMLVSYSEAEKLAFINMYVEEINALNRQMQADLASLNAQAEVVAQQQVADEQGMQSAWTIVFGVLVALGFVIFLLSRI